MTGDAPPPAPQQPAGPRHDFDIDEVQGIIQRFFKVYEVEREIKGVPVGQLAAYYIQTEAATFNERFEALREAVRGFDPGLLVILQHRLGEDVLLVARKPPVQDRGPTLHVVLLVLTVLTTTISGALFYQPMSGDENLLTFYDHDVSFLHPKHLFWGFVTFSLPLILILGIHELGHFFVARRHRVRTSLPYFIPVPPIVPIGTFGAFISMKEPIPDRKALFDIGASGPLAGFIFAIPVVILGLVLTAVTAVPVPLEPEVHAGLFTSDPAASFEYDAALVDDDHFENRTFAFGHANYTVEHRSSDSTRTYYERIEFVAEADQTVPLGEWRFELAAIHLDEGTGVDVTIRYSGPNLANATTVDFERQDDGSWLAQLEHDFDAQGSRGFNYTFEVPANATAASAELRWERPPSPYVRLGDSLLFYALQWGVDQVFPVEENVFTHPTGIAGWVGLLVTGFNLLPAGQLDGGHVARAVLGDRMRWASYASVALMFFLSFRFPGWIIMAILIVFLGLQHPPPLNDKSPLDARRRAWAVFILILLFVTFVPFPFVRP